MQEEEKKEDVLDPRKAIISKKIKKIIYLLSLTNTCLHPPVGENSLSYNVYPNTLSLEKYVKLEASLFKFLTRNEPYPHYPYCYFAHEQKEINSDKFQKTSKSTHHPPPSTK